MKHGIKALLITLSLSTGPRPECHSALAAAPAKPTTSRNQSRLLQHKVSSSGFQRPVTKAPGQH